MQFIFHNIMVEPQPSVYPFGIRIDEPLGTLTDVLVAIVCFYAFYKLNKRKLPGRTQLYLRFYFLLMGIATLSGGVIGHGFLYAMSFGWKLPGWIIGMISIAMIERSAIAHARPLIKPRIGKFFLVFNLIELFIIITITMTTLDFKWVELHSGYGLLVIVATFHGYTYYRNKDKGSLIILGGVAITGIASLVFINKLSIHTWYNYLDISHTLLAIAAYVMYLGACRLRKTEEKRRPLNGLIKVDQIAERV
ncbi:MAG: hypothetical protein C0490_20860, partial [Marivirga sp.]|nr:hypothetical protein [Marivirga sp.]